MLVKLLQSADVLVENFAPGSMAKRGLGPEHLEKINPRLVYCALKGFLPRPYEKRPALDEVVQMMGGLAYMTGPSGRPLRAGTSVVDIMGGLFGALGTVLALKQRDGNSRAVDLHKGAGGKQRPGMDVLGQQPFARAVLALDQYGNIRAEDFPHQLAHRLHRC